MRLVRLAAALVLPLAAAPSLPAQTTPAVPQTASAPDAERLAAARAVVLKLLPPGAYERMLGESFDSMMDAMIDSMGTLPLGQIARIGGITEEQAAKIGEASIEEMMGIYDPHWRERAKLTTTGMMSEMGELMGKFEPQVRDAMARAYARDFTLEELTELLRFFETPAGAHYAERSLQIYSDKEVVAEMSGMMPEIMREMPAIIEKVKKLEATLPPRRRIEELTGAERRRLGEILGVSPDELKDPGEGDEST